MKNTILLAIGICIGLAGCTQHKPPNIESALYHGYSNKDKAKKYLQNSINFCHEQLRYYRDGSSISDMSKIALGLLGSFAGSAGAAASATSVKSAWSAVAGATNSVLIPGVSKSSLGAEDMRKKHEDIKTFMRTKLVEIGNISEPDKRTNYANELIAGCI